MYRKRLRLQNDHPEALFEDGTVLTCTQKTENRTSVHCILFVFYTHGGTQFGTVWNLVGANTRGGGVRRSGGSGSGGGGGGSGGRGWLKKYRRNSKLVFS